MLKCYILIDPTIHAQEIEITPRTNWEPCILAKRLILAMHHGQNIASGSRDHLIPMDINVNRLDDGDGIDYRRYVDETQGSVVQEMS